MFRKQHSLPLEAWDRVVAHMGEWLLVGSIAAAGLPAIPGIISLVVLFGFFIVHPEHQPPEPLRRFNELEKKKVKTHEEQMELEHYQADLLKASPRRRTTCGWLGLVVWIAAVVYVFLYKGAVKKEWL
jgi:hypothetical protein